jgi:outer membrane protein assembly factor BamB
MIRVGIRQGALAVAVFMTFGVALSGCQVLRAPAALFDFKKKDNTRIATGQRIPVLEQNVALIPAAALKGVDFSLPAPQPQADWPTPGGNPEQSIEHVDAGANFQIAWRRNIGAGDSTGQGFLYSNIKYITAAPVVGDGRLYILDGRSELSALDPKTGHEIWRTDIANHRGAGREGFGGGVAYGDGRVYVTSGFRFVDAYDARTGKLIWRTPTAAPVHGAPTVAGDKLYVVDVSDQLQTFDTKTGQSLWTYQALDESARMLISSSPAVSGDEVIAPFASGELVGLNAANGNDLWNDVLSLTNRNNALSEIRDIAGRPVISKGLVYAGSHSGIVAAVDIRTGQRAWSLPTAAITTPWAAGDVVYVVDQQGRVICIARDSGQIYWIRGLNDGIRKKFRAVYSGPILASNHLVLVSSKGVALALDPKTGATLKTLRLGSPAFVTPIAVDGLIYVVTNTGDLIAIR